MVSSIDCGRTRLMHQKVFPLQKFLHPGDPLKNHSCSTVMHCNAMHSSNCNPMHCSQLLQPTHVVTSCSNGMHCSKCSPVQQSSRNWNLPPRAGALLTENLSWTIVQPAATLHCNTAQQFTEIPCPDKNTTLRHTKKNAMAHYTTLGHFTTL